MKCKIVSNCNSTIMICLVNALALCSSNDNICPNDAPSPSALRTLPKQVLMCEIDMAPKNPFYPLYFWSRMGMFCALGATWAFRLLFTLEESLINSLTDQINIHSWISSCLDNTETCSIMGYHLVAKSYTAQLKCCLSLSKTPHTWQCILFVQILLMN